MGALGVLVLVLLVGSLTVACADETGESAAQTPRTVTVTEAETVTSPADTASSASSTREVPASSVEESAPPGAITVPDVVGLDHQLAQDTMQAAGLYSLAEEDATGQGRLLVWDRNWTVVSQSPAAGTAVNEDTTITLSSKKDGE